jgi:hypothetical protein
VYQQRSFRVILFNYTSYYQRTGVCRRRIGIYHLRLVLCVPNIYNKIPLPHQNHHTILRLLGANSSDQAEKLVEKFQRYVAFRKINETDQLQLFHLLMRDQAANWLTSLPDNKRLDIHDLLHQFQKRYELLRVAKWKQTANLWKRKQGLD